MRHGGQILVDSLKALGVTRVFCVPGESFLPVLDGLYQSGIETVVCRQEGGAAMMAEAHGKLTGTPGIVFVTRGPGATNAAAGVHVAMQDSTPMILFVGQVERGYRDREAFQEVDCRAMFGPICKWVAEIDETDRIPEYLSHAWHTAMAGRRGPVVLSLVEDALFESADVPDARPATAMSQGATPEDASAIWAALAKAERPMVVVGGGGWSAGVSRDLQRLAERSGLPVCASFRRQDYMDNRHPNYVGDLGLSAPPALLDEIRGADCLLVIGTRLSEMSTAGYSVIDIPSPRQTFLHVHSGPDELGRVYRPDIAVNAASGAMIARLLETLPSDLPDWRGRTARLRAVSDAHCQPEPTIGDVRLEEIFTHLNNVLPDNAILTNGAGNYSGFLARYYRFRQFGTQLAPTSGSMGYGLPAAVAAKLERPDTPVICVAGDGCFQMCMQELGTARQYGAGIVVILCNNSIYGTIRMHQERRYPGRVSGTTMVNPDFAALARSYGFHATTVTRTADFPAALEAALAAEGGALIDLRHDPRVMSHRMVLKE